jgi:hypothetical protein
VQFGTEGVCHISRSLTQQGHVITLLLRLILLLLLHGVDLLQLL